ncbi:cyclic-di-AMP receptor [Dolosigranulum savutiense]|uniref:Cyclic-di-AMP receptor n=1 Tax=Dolosigranulum savutiense TaxID=3110288 RepID=A0AB74U3W5_9LACT
MKLVVAIIQNQDSRRLQDIFVEQGIRATKLSSTGGFLRAGNTTFLIGAKDRKVDDILAIIQENCSTREQKMVNPASYDFTIETDLTFPIDVEVGGATVFVLPVEAFHQF